MSIKDVAQKILPKGTEQLLRNAVYAHNQRLPKSRYRKQLEKWYRLSKGRPLDLDSPKRLGEKIQWLKLYDSIPEKGRLADKFLARDWVSERIGSDYLVPILGVWETAESIDLSGLPEKFVLKATHGSGWNIIVKNKQEFDLDSERERIRDWLGSRMSMRGGFELHYDFCEPRIIAEQYLEDSSGGLRDYKFIVINGKVRFVLAIEGRYDGEHSFTYYPDWTPAPFTYGYRVGYVQEIERPEKLDEMVSLAEKLSESFCFARVDFYEVGGKIYFGEITFTPANGLSDFVPDEYDFAFGEELLLPEKKQYMGEML